MSYFEGNRSTSEGTLVTVFEEIAKRFPNVAAIETQSKSVSYRDLLSSAKKIAKRLNRNGVGHGDRVVVKLPTGESALYETILGILFSGATYVPLDSEDSETRLSNIALTCQAAAVISDSGIEIRKIGKLALSSPSPNSDAWIIFTSGSTGVPKAVAVTHESAVNFVVAEQEIFGQDRLLKPGTRVAATLSPAFDASVEEMWLAWANGGTLVPIKREVLTSGPDLASGLASARIEILSTIPSIARFLIDGDLGHLKLLILGGEAVTAELSDGLQRSGLEVWNTYGPTETTVVATATPLSKGEPVTIGFPLQGVAIAVLDENERPVELGEIGELVIAGKCMGRYLDDANDKKKFRSVSSLGWNRSYFTGDFVKVTIRGLEFVGRIDEQIKIGGKRIDLTEVEKVASGIQAVAAASAVAVRSEEGDYGLHCFLVLRDGNNSDDIQNELLTRLPAGIKPILHVLESLPIKTSGKVDKSSLSQLVQNPFRDDQEGSYIAREFSRVLGLERVNENDNFFAKGGTSIKVAQLVVRLRKKFLSVTVADVYKNPTPAALEQALASRKNSLTPSNTVDTKAHGNKIRSLLSVLLQISVASALGFLFLILLSFGGMHLKWFEVFLLLGVFTFVGAGFGRSVISAILIRFITHRIKSGRYARNGITHLRIWLAERICDIFFVSELAGSPWMILFARITGARIEQGCTIESLPPVLGNLSMGPHSSIGRDVHIAGWNISEGSLLVDGFNIGSGVRIGNRSFLEEGVSIGSGTEIEVGTFVDRSVGSNLVIQGSPMVETVGFNWPVDIAKNKKRWALAYALSPSLFALVHLATYLPIILLMQGVTDGAGVAQLGWMLVSWGLVLGPSTSVLNTLGQGVMIRIAASRVKPGLFSADSREGYASWVVERLIQRTRRNSYWIYASVVTPIWARLLGAKVGKNCEISTFNGQIGLVEIGDECFIADDVSLAPRELKKGWVRIGSVRLENRSFMGNSGHARADVKVSAGVLVGVASIAPPNNMPHAAFLGIPPVEFPHVATQDEIRLTYAPTALLKAKRLFVEIFRLLPAAISYLLLGSILIFLDQLVTNNDSQLKWVLFYGILYTLASYVAVWIAISAKWLLVGRVVKSEHRLWTNFVWRNELVWNFVESLVVPWVASVTIDTPIHNHFLRMMGAKIGKNVSLTTWFLDDPDLIRIGDNSTIMKSADLQTHLFHDRLMRLDSVNIGEYSTIGSGAFILPGSRVGSCSSIAAGSLVPRDEVVPELSRWFGNPIEAR